MKPDTLDLDAPARPWLSTKEVSWLLGTSEARLRHLRTGRTRSNPFNLADPVKLGGRYFYRVSDVLLALRELANGPTDRLHRLMTASSANTSSANTQPEKD